MRTGALFREETKAKDGWENFHLPVSHPDYGKLLVNWELYGIHCFRYIHFNPLEAGLVDVPEDWPYSSSMDFAGLRKGTMCNQALAKEVLGLV
jgi:putative transposase